MIHKEVLNDVDIPDAIISVLELIKQRGFRGYIVGGAIRDVLIGRVPVEYDLATNAHPSDIMAWFDHVSDAGLKYGTVSIHLNGHIIEVTTFRKDAKYLDFRHPSEVVFTSSIHDDLMRRDFTINAMAYLPITSECIDNFGAIEHLNQRRLICVGHPYMIGLRKICYARFDVFVYCLSLDLSWPPMLCEHYMICHMALYCHR